MEALIRTDGCGPPGEEMESLSQIRDVGRSGIDQVAGVEEVHDRIREVLLPQCREAGRQLYEVFIETLEVRSVPAGSQDFRRARSQRGDVGSQLSATPGRRCHGNEVGDRQRDHHQTGARGDDGRQLPDPVTRNEVPDPECEHGVSHEVQPVDQIRRHVGRGVANRPRGDTEHQ
jgi:hypothetical protein